MTVDLNRLREARERAESIFDAGGLDYLSEDNPIWLTSGAVLDAPTVWWCEAYQGGRGHMDEPCVAGSNHDYPMPCRWVALVPVKGEN